MIITALRRAIDLRCGDKIFIKLDTPEKEFIKSIRGELIQDILIHNFADKKSNKVELKIELLVYTDNVTKGNINIFVKENDLFEVIVFGG